MENIDYAAGIDCPEGLCDEDMFMRFVICEECELLFLDTMLTETFSYAGSTVAY